MQPLPSTYVFEGDGELTTQTPCSNHHKSIAPQFGNGSNVGVTLADQVELYFIQANLPSKYAKNCSEVLQILHVT